MSPSPRLLSRGYGEPVRLPLTFCHLLAWACPGLLSRVYGIDVLQPTKIWYYRVLRYVASLLFGLYILSRAYLLANVIFALRNLADSCYNTPGWTTFVPHF